MKDKNKNWCNWFVNIGSKQKAPNEWVVLWRNLLKLGVERKLLEKVEAASMVIRGKRTERWLINNNDHEYASQKDALEATKKLVYQAVISDGSPYSEQTKKNVLKKIAPGRNGHIFSVERRGKRKKSRENKLSCSICGETIEYKQIMGKGRAKRGSKLDPKVCTMGHIDPLTAGGKHNARNVSWQHKYCNDCQGNLSRSDFLRLLSKILKFSRKI
jgi:hypothetical protein